MGAARAWRQERLPRTGAGFAAGDPSRGPWLARALWTIRWKVGELLGWDEAETGLGGRVPTLRQRLPEDLLDAPGPDFDTLPFTSLYLIEDEFAAEIANRTMHGIMHLSSVLTGPAVTAARWPSSSNQTDSSGPCTWPQSDPSGYLIVYPAAMRQIEREWTRSDRTIKVVVR